VVSNVKRAFVHPSVDYGLFGNPGIGMGAGSVGRGSLDRQYESGYGSSRQRGFHVDHHRNELHRDYDLVGSGAITGAFTSANQGVLSWDQSLSATYAWDATAPGTGTYLIASGAQGAASCAVISATKFVCAAQADPSPSVQVMQK
jgi:hypothetical protein